MRCEFNWQLPSELNVPDPQLKNWLLDTGSLTERLQANCRTFSVQLLGQKVVPVTLEERQQLGQISEDIIVREVILKGDDCPWVFARSLMPVSLCEDGVDDLANLGTKPLGKVIFNDNRFIREPFQVCQLNKNNGLLSKLGGLSSQELWGRRSVFSYLNFKMMVAEVFLPDSPAYSNMV